MFLSWETSRDFRSVCIQLFRQQDSCFKKAWNLFLLSDLATSFPSLGTRLDPLEEYFGTRQLSNNDVFGPFVLKMELNF